MADRIGTRDEAAADEDDLAQAAKQGAWIFPGAIRALLRRTEALEERMRGAVLRLDGLGQEAHDRANPGVLDLGGTAHLFPMFVRYTPDADMRTAGLTPERVYAVIGRDTRCVRLEGDDGKPVDIAPRFLVAVPGPADSSKPNPGKLLGCSCGAPMSDGVVHRALAPCYHAETGASVPDEVPFLTPPPIARAIGRAVMAAAARFPASNPTNARHFETIAKASAEVKTEAAATLGRAIDRVLALGEWRGLPLTTSATDSLRMAQADAKRAGVIP